MPEVKHIKELSALECGVKVETQDGKVIDLASIAGRLIVWAKKFGDYVLVKLDGIPKCLVKFDNVAIYDKAITREFIKH